ncbi:MAG: diacylglycerol kinase family protein [Vampirovibrionales bacterium]|nr:diacylglycerol kinase family protein [Vampirovibrionales bacterium]
MSRRRRFRARTFWHSLRYAVAGLDYVVRTQRNFRIHLALAACVALAGVLTRLSPIEWMGVTLAIGLVWTAEILNTAIEALGDLYTEGEFSLMAKIAKDAAASACLVSALTAVVVGALAFGPHLAAWLRLSIP